MNYRDLPVLECVPTNLTDNAVEETQESLVPIASNGEVFPWDDVRLPIFISPIVYDLYLRPNLTTLGVYGIIRMEFKVRWKTFFWQISYSVTERLTEWPDLAHQSLSLSNDKKYCLQVTEETDFIVFHMAGMNITSKKINEKLKIRKYFEAFKRLETNLYNLQNIGIPSERAGLPGHWQANETGQKVFCSIKIWIRALPITGGLLSFNLQR